jgi:hypothetical protein
MDPGSVLAAPLPLVIRPGGALGVWAALVGGALLVAAGLMAVAWLQRDRGGPRRERPAAPGPQHCTRLHLEAAELARHAALAATAAERAEADAAAAHHRYLAAQRTREQAWREYEAAYRSCQEVRRANRVLVGAGAAAGPVDRTDAAEQVERAALAAYRRGDLDVEELRLVLRRANGWNPSAEQRERDVTIGRSAETRASRAYYAASTAERQARRSADVTFVAARALAQEAAVAAYEARTATAAARACAAHGR